MNVLYAIGNSGDAALAHGAHIARLLAEGEAQGRTFLAELQDAEGSSDFGAKGTSVETH